MNDGRRVGCWIDALALAEWLRRTINYCETTPLYEDKVAGLEVALGAVERMAVNGRIGFKA